uniref:Uncharacterized protein n=1 Tax=Mycena chlorophos TaxID=658473 RepID=A0ABQ0MD18_MYCCL|nr:predicted protein [Mycena chlorophos]
MNLLFGGWNITFNPFVDRLLWVNGEFDPWRDPGVASQLPQAPKFVSTSTQPILVVKTGVHCWDMITSSALGNPNTAVVFNQVVAQITTWMKEFKAY